MSFKEAYIAMLSGYKIKRPCFEGYWYIDGYTGKTFIHTRDNKEISNNCDLSLTLTNVMANDWQLVTEEV